MTTSTSTYRREIVWDRETKDYAMYLDDELVGFARNHHEAEVTLDQLVFELISGEFFREAPAEQAPAETHPRVAEPAPELVYVEPLLNTCEICNEAKSDDCFSLNSGPFADNKVTVCDDCVYALTRLPAVPNQPSDMFLSQEPAPLTDSGSSRQAPQLLSGRDLARLWWREHTAAVAHLAALSEPLLRAQAAAYIAYLQSFSRSDVTADSVLQVWHEHIGRARVQ